MLVLDKFPNSDLGNQKKSGVKKRGREGKPDTAAVMGTSHLSASLPENTEGLGIRARGRTWT